MHTICASTRTVSLLLGLVVLAVGCERVKSSTPLSPSLAGPIAGVTISAPAVVEPAAGRIFRDSEQPLTLVFGNAESNSVRPFSMTFEIGTDAAFTTTVFRQTGIAPAAEGVNRVLLPSRLQPGREYHWRVKADDGANASEWSPATVFAILQPIVIGRPDPLSPIGGARVLTNNPTLRVRNGASSGPYGPLFYQFQASTSPAFTGLVGNQSVPEGPGETTLLVPASPGPDTLVYWRVRISDDEGNIGDWSRTESYRTPLVSAPPTPTPAPGGGPCVSSNPQQIVECERAKWGHMSTSQMAVFMRSVASSLNANGIGGGPFGVLRKTSGHNCEGISCDIICAGNGGSQKQWDVLGDIDGAQSPGWNGPLPTIRVDLCEVP